MMLQVFQAELLQLWVHTGLRIAHLLRRIFSVFFGIEFFYF